MKKRYILLGILVITVALLISAFAWVSTKGSSGLLVGTTQGSVTIDKGERDFISPSLQLAPFQAGKVLVVAGQFVDDHYPISSMPSAELSVTERLAAIQSSPGLVVAGQYIDDHYPISSVPSAELSVTERLAAIQSSSYAALAAQYQGHIYPSLSSSYLVVVSAFHDR